ncbi:MAG: DinB family protein [Gammaproteobacteria bacterium]|nr:DinB family protein [Gammaproteobacteria bacterium]
MALLEHLKVMADYHQWAHVRLLNYVEPLSNEEYHQPCGLYFTSVHGTYNHMLVGDCLWYGRFVNEQVDIPGLDHELCSSRESLMAALTVQANKWVDYMEQLTEERLEGKLTYRSTVGGQYALPTGQLLAHVFNHGTHHRGQVSSVVTQLGYPCPEIDLVYFMLRK